MHIRDNNDEEFIYLQQLNKHQDVLDVFINLILKRSPTFFVLINMTLMIWLVQTIFSSNLQSIPRSIYLLTPYFAARPINQILMTEQDDCPNGYEKINIKTFPSIKVEHISKLKMNKWGEEGQLICVKRLEQKKNIESACHENMTSCSGFCEQNASDCPITDIKKVSSTEKIPVGYELFFTNKKNGQKYILSRKSRSNYIVGILATYDHLCTNDYKFYDQYNQFSDYWKQTKECGQEGTLTSSIFSTFDHVDASQFFINNGVNSPFIQSAVASSQVELGFLNQFKFKNNTDECSDASSLSKEMDKYLFKNPVKPSFTRSLLVVAFIFFTGCWAWLIGFYCFEGKKKEKNMIVLLLAIIEIIVVSFIYSQNVLLFQTENVVKEISSCIINELPAVSNWNFGITSSFPFTMIMFTCTAFLLLEIVANFLDHCVYEPYQPV